MSILLRFRITNRKRFLLCACAHLHRWNGSGKRHHIPRTCICVYSLLLFVTISYFQWVMSVAVWRRVSRTTTREWFQGRAYYSQSASYKSYSRRSVSYPFDLFRVSCWTIVTCMLVEMSWTINLHWVKCVPFVVLAMHMPGSIQITKS